MRFSVVRSLLLALPLGLAAPTATSCQSPSAASLQAVKNAFSQSGIVPSFIPRIDPTLLVQISYAVKPVNLGTKFKTPETLAIPTVSLTKESGSTTASNYTLIFLNFDNPNPALPTAAHLPFVHWQVSHIKPCAGLTGSSTDALYISLAPPSVAEDRYTFLVYREPKGYTPQLISPNARAPFDPNAYAKQGGLTLVGGNFLLEGQKNNIPPV